RDDERGWIEGFHTEEQAREEMREPQRSGNSNYDSYTCQKHALADDHVANGRCLRTQRHADAELLRALLHRVRHESVDSDRRYQQRRRAEDGEQEHVEALARSGGDDDLVHAADVCDGKTAAGVAQSDRDRLRERMRLLRAADDPPQRRDARVERRDFVRHLRDRNVHGRSGIAIEAVAAHVACYADNLARWFAEYRSHIGADQETVVQRVAIRPELFRHRLVDDYDARR